MVDRDDLLYWLNSEITQAFVERLLNDADDKRTSALSSIKVGDVAQAQAYAGQADTISELAGMINEESLPGWLDLSIKE